MHTNGAHKDTLESFLRSETIGPLTGLCDLFADLDLISEISKLPGSVQSEAYHGVAACYDLREDGPRLLAILKERPQERLSIYRFSEEIRKQNDRGGERPHRFKTLMASYRKLRDIEKDLEAALKHEDFTISLLKGETNEEAAKEVWNKSDAGRHATLARLLGVTLAAGRIDDARKYADQLKRLPERDDHEYGSHARAVIAYLDTGGEATIRRRLAFRGGTNPYWWKHHAGDDSMIRRYMRECGTDLTTNWFTTAVYTGAGATGMLVYGNREAIKARVLELAGDIARLIGM